MAISERKEALKNAKEEGKTVDLSERAPGSILEIKKDHDKASDRIKHEVYEAYRDADISQKDIFEIEQSSRNRELEIKTVEQIYNSNMMNDRIPVQERIKRAEEELEKSKENGEFESPHLVSLSDSPSYEKATSEELLAISQNDLDKYRDELKNPSFGRKLLNIFPWSKKKWKNSLLDTINFCERNIESNKKRIEKSNQILEDFASGTYVYATKLAEERKKSFKNTLGNIAAERKLKEHQRDWLNK